MIVGVMIGNTILKVNIYIIKYTAYFINNKNNLYFI